MDGGVKKRRTERDADRHELTWVDYWNECRKGSRRRRGESEEEKTRK
jgi:hypothetical protein